MNAIKCVRTYPVGCVNDLKTLLQQLPDDIDGLDETYLINHFKNEKTDEQWIEIIPND